MQIATEQPIFIALLIRKLKLNIVAESNYPKMFYAAAINHYVTKIVTTIMIWYYYGQMLSAKDGDHCSPWFVYDVSFKSFLQRDDAHFDLRLFSDLFLGILSPILFLLQMWQGYAYYLMGRPRKAYLVGTGLVRVGSDDLEIEMVEEPIANVTEPDVIHGYGPNTGYSRKSAHLRRRSSVKSLVQDPMIEEKENYEEQRLSQNESERERRKSKDD